MTNRRDPSGRLTGREAPEFGWSYRHGVAPEAAGEVDRGPVGGAERTGSAADRSGWAGGRSGRTGDPFGGYRDRPPAGDYWYGHGGQSVPGVPPPGAPALAPEPQRLGGLLAGAMLGVVLGAASSTVTTALAVGVAGSHADRLFQPIEFTIRVGLLLVAPPMGAVVAALFAAIVLPKRVVVAPWAVGLGIVVGPILALRLERATQFGSSTTVTFGLLLVCWAVVGGILAAVAAARTAPRPGPDRPGSDRPGSDSVPPPYEPFQGRS
jgi:hypothetical protein